MRAKVFYERIEIENIRLKKNDKRIKVLKQSQRKILQNLKFFIRNFRRTTFANMWYTPFLVVFVARAISKIF